MSIRLVLDGTFGQPSWCGSCAQRLGCAVLAARGRALLWAPSSPWVDISMRQAGDGTDPSPFGSSWVLWLMLGGCLPRQALPPPCAHEAVALWGRCHVRALRPRAPLAATFLPPRHCQPCSAGRPRGKG